MTVQNFVGMPEDDLISWADSNGISVSRSETYSDTYEEGMIISQSLKSGEISKGTTISYVVSKGKNPDEGNSGTDSGGDNKNPDSGNSGTEDPDGNTGSSSTDSKGIWESNIAAWASEHGIKDYTIKYEKSSSVETGKVIRHETGSDGKTVFYVSKGA